MDKAVHILVDILWTLSAAKHTSLALQSPQVFWNVTEVFCI